MIDSVQCYDGDGVPRGIDLFLESFHNPLNVFHPIELKARMPDKPALMRTGGYDLVMEVQERIARGHVEALRMIIKTGQFALIPQLVIHCQFGFNDHVFNDLVAMDISDARLHPATGRNGTPIEMMRLELLVRWRDMKVVETH